MVEVEKRGSAYHLTFYIYPNPEPVGFFRLTKEEHDEYLPLFLELDKNVGKHREAKAPRITSG